MKKYLALFLVLVIFSAFAATAFAQPIFTLDVAVNPSARLNVTYTAKIYNISSTQPQLVRFYTDYEQHSFPPIYVGSAYTNNIGVATFSFHQDPGVYFGGATFETGDTYYSNIVKYIVN